MENTKTLKTIKEENTELKKSIETLENERKDSTTTNGTTIYKEKTLILDNFLNNMKNDIKNKINNEGYKTYIETCEGKLPDNIELKQYEMSIDVIDKIIAKLAESTEVDSDITASFFCPKYRLGIYKGNRDCIFGLNQADNTKMLIVGYNNRGYAFAFNEDVSTFIKDLLNK